MAENIDSPLASINMVTLNRAKYIGAAIESILNQNFLDWELIIVDGGSRDNTDQIVSKYLGNPKIKFIKLERNLGLTGNRNYALSLSRGKYIAVLDSDDVWLDENKLSKQVEMLEKKEELILVGTNFEKIDENGKTFASASMAETDDAIRNKLLLLNEFCHSSVMFRKEPALRAGSYDSSLFIWEDYDLWLRLGKIGKLANLPSFSTAYRIHKGGISNARKVKGAFTNLKIIRRYRKDYPHFLEAYLKGVLRIGARVIGL